MELEKWSDASRQAAAEARRSGKKSLPKPKATEFSTKQRERLAESGAAMEGGGYPIRNMRDLSNAIHAYGRAKNKAAVKAHIISRARVLNAGHLIPAGWVSKSLEDRIQKLDSRIQFLKALCGA